jgi:hypothetical protein
MNGIVNVDKQKNVLIESVRYADAGHILKGEKDLVKNAARDEQR